VTANGIGRATIWSRAEHVLSFNRLDNAARDALRLTLTKSQESCTDASGKRSQGWWLPSVLRDASSITRHGSYCQVSVVALAWSSTAGGLTTAGDAQQPGLFGLKEYCREVVNILVMHKSQAYIFEIAKNNLA
jgi:hypothetical protein